MKTLAIIESPLQAMSLLEFCNIKNIEAKSLVLVVNLNTNVSPNNKLLIDSVFSFYKFVVTDVASYYEYDVTESFFSLAMISKKIIRLEKELKAGEYLYMLIGEFRSHIALNFANKLNVSDVVFLDDGNAIKRAPAIRNVKERRKVRFKKNLLSCFKYNLKVLDFITYFSAFLIDKDLINSKDKLIKNHFIKLSSIKDCTSSEDEYLGVIGSPLSAAGVCSTENEEMANQVLIEFLQEPLINGRKIVYFPHRRENAKKLEYFKKHGIEINKEQAPIEIKLMKYSNIKLVGFYSSCFETLPLLYPTIEILSIILPPEFAEINWRSFVKMQYDTYSQIKNITVVNGALN